MDDTRLVLHFYLMGNQYLVASLKSGEPLIFLAKDRPPIKKQAQPVALFLSAHGKNLRLKNIFVDLDVGRRVILVLMGGEKTCEVIFDLIPRSPNLVVKSQEKSVSFFKPKDLPAPASVAFEKIDKDWDLWCAEVQEFMFSSGANKSSGDLSQVKAKGRVRALEKKKKALAVLIDSLGGSRADLLRQQGEALKSEGVVDGELIQDYFQKAKALEKKMSGTRDRVRVLENEILALEVMTDEEFAQMGQSKIAQRKSPAVSAGASFRKIDLGSDIVASIGKSAADNLALLRKARAWDLWVHLKDEPSAHGIVFRRRDQDVTREQIEKVAFGILRQKKGRDQGFSGRLEVVVVECRHVRPIKGDRLGRVQYQNPAVYTFASKPRS